MQEGSVIREPRKLGPDVWCYRWWESGPSGNRVHRRIVLGTATKKAYQGYLRKWIVPRWGDFFLPNIKAVEVELWLKHLERAAGTCCKIRNVMSVLFNHARRYDLYDRNPIQWVRQSAKRRSAPDVLTSDEVRHVSCVRIAEGVAFA